MASSFTLNPKPSFFKVLFSDPFANLFIPKNFYKHLPPVPPKEASLESQSGKFWRVAVNESEEGIYFSKGWSRFAMAHDLQIGYFLVFRHKGNMNFSVKVFDRTCCLKVYALTPSIPPIGKSESSNFVGPSNHIKSESDTEIWVVSGSKRKYASSKAKEDIKERMPTSKRTRRTSPNMPTVRQFETTLSWYSTTTYRTHLYILKRFCIENGLVSNRTIFLKNSKEEKWPVKLVLREKCAELRKGWRYFSTKNGLKEGDKCIFQLITKDTFLVNVMPHPQRLMGEKQQTAYKKPNSYTVDSKKMIEKKKENSDPFRECERRIAHYNTIYGYLTFPKVFCEQNNLTSKRKMKLKDSKSREWAVIFSPYRREGRLTSGWRDFTKEKKLKEGDKLKFKVVAHDTLLFHLVRE